jgi:hypothetical protein
MTDNCERGYDYQETCQRYYIIGCHEGYFEELKDGDNPSGYTKKCRYLLDDDKYD